MMTTLQLPLLRPDQSVIAKHGAKIKVVAMGRRWGKSTLGGTMGLTAANFGCNVCWLVPSYKRSRALWRFVVNHTAALKKTGQVRINKSDLLIDFTRTGGMLGIYSDENPDSIRGDAFHLVIIDEAAYVKEDTITDVILPTLADYDGDLMLISSPNGMNHFFSWYQRGLSDGVEVASWRAPTTDNPSPTIRAKYEKMKLLTPAHKFAQEWDAEFREDAGIFQNVRESATAIRQHSPEHNHKYSFGLDFGRVNDYTVIAVYDQTINALVNLDRFTDMNFDAQLARIEHWYNRFHPEVMVCEQNNFGAPLIETMRNRGMPVQAWTTTLASKNEMIDELALRFQMHDISIIPDEILISELLAFTGKRLASGLYQYSAPSGMHDDTVIALGLVVFQSRYSTIQLWVG